MVGLVLFAGGISLLVLALVLENSGFVGGAISLLAPGILFVFLGAKNYAAARMAAQNNTNNVIIANTAPATAGDFQHQQVTATTGDGYGFQHKQLPDSPPPYSYNDSSVAPPPSTYAVAT